MVDEGLRRYAEGLAKGPHDSGIPRNPKAPDYFMREVEKDKKTKENLLKIAPSYKRTLLRWLLRAKLEKTRKKRIKCIVQALRTNKKLFPAA